MTGSDKPKSDDLSFERPLDSEKPPATHPQSVGEAMHGDGPLPPPEVSHPGWDDDEED